MHRNRAKSLIKYIIQLEPTVREKNQNADESRIETILSSTLEVLYNIMIYHNVGVKEGNKIMLEMFAMSKNDGKDLYRKICDAVEKENLYLDFYALEREYKQFQSKDKK